MNMENIKILLDYALDILPIFISIMALQNQIVKSKLPTAFFLKNGDRDIIRSSQYIRHLIPEVGLYVETYPFFVIVSAVDYQYNGQEHTDILLSS